MSGSKSERRWPSASATPWDGASPEELGPAELLVMRGHRDLYAARHEAADEAGFFNAYEREACPWCGGRPWRDGFDRRGVRRWRCASCGRRFGPATGTIFEDAKLPVREWAEFLAQVLSYESIAEVTRLGRRSPTTPPYWLAKTFAVLEGVQDGVVLSGRVELDETYFPVAGRDVVRVDGRELRGLSRNKLCIGIACDAGRSVFVEEGVGKTSGRRTWEAMGSHISAGSELVHDLEKAHGRLVRDLGLASEAHDSREIKLLPDKDNPLGRVNHLCDLCKQFLRAHSGFDRGDLQHYLDLFAVAMNPPSDKMEKAAMVLDRAMRCPRTLRFREYYRRNADVDKPQGRA